ncbi:MAG: glycosyltransferase [Thermodesulfobacteriota bacterium]
MIGLPQDGPRKMRIAMFCVHSHPLGRLGTTDTGGMSVYIRQIAYELGKSGHQVDIFTRFTGLHAEKMLQLSENVRLIQLKAGEKKPLNRLALHACLAEFIKGVESFRLESKVDYDLIHSHYWLSGLAGLWAQKHWSRPLVITFHTVAAVKKKLAADSQDPKIRLTHEKELMQSCDLVVALTEFERQEISQLCAGQQANIAVIPCGVDLERFSPLAKMAARQGLGLADNERVLLYVGRIDPLKGLDRLLAAVALLQQNASWRLIIVGGDESPGQEERHLREMTRKLNIEECVTLAGSQAQQDLPRYYSAADLFVSPSYYESFGLTGLEALACGTPVVASNVGVFPQLLANRFVGRVRVNASPESLAAKIKELFMAGEKGNIPAGLIRNTVKGYSWRRVAQSLHWDYLGLVRANNSKAVGAQPFPGKNKLKEPQPLIQ